MQNDIEELKKYISNLDIDITNRMPWGDLQVNYSEEYIKGSKTTRFWTAPNDCFEANQNNWIERYNANFVSKGDFLTYFTTFTLSDIEIIMEGAEEAYVCPCPTSTLIMMQTRAKDLLKELTQELSDTNIPMRKRDKMKSILKRITQI